MNDPLSATHAELAQLFRVAGQIGIYFAQRRSRELDEARRGDMLRERALAQQLRTETLAGQEFYKNVDRQEWWDRAAERDVANAYGFAKRFAKVDPEAVAAVATIEREVEDRWGIDLRAEENTVVSSLNPSEVAAPVLGSDAPTPEELRNLVDEALRAMEREQARQVQEARDIEVKEVPETQEALSKTDELSPEQVDTEVSEAHQAIVATDIEREVEDRWGIDLRAEENIVVSSLNPSEVEAPVLGSDAPTPEELRNMVDEALRAMEREQARQVQEARDIEVKEVSEAQEALSKPGELSPEQVDTEVRESHQAIAATDTLEARHDWVRQQALAGANQEVVRSVSTASKMNAQPISGAILHGASKRKASGTFKPSMTPTKSASRQR